MHWLISGCLFSFVMDAPTKQARVIHSEPVKYTNETRKQKAQSIELGQHPTRLPQNLSSFCSLTLKGQFL
jgi:hypothetical protein